MNRRFLVIMLLFSLLLSCNVAFAGTYHFKLTNRAPQEIVAVYLAPADSNDWTGDALEGQNDGPLASGKSANLAFNVGEPDNWDIKIVTEDGRERVWPVDFREVHQLTFTKMYMLSY